MPCWRGKDSGNKLKWWTAQLEMALSYLSLTAQKGSLGPAVSLPCTGGGYTACPGRGFHMASLVPPLPPVARNTQFAQDIFQLTKGYIFLVVKGGMKRTPSWESDLGSCPSCVNDSLYDLGQVTFPLCVLVSFFIGSAGWSGGPLRALPALTIYNSGCHIIWSQSRIILSMSLAGSGVRTPT